MKTNQEAKAVNREIKFRGRRTDNDQWIIGNLVIDGDGVYQIWDYANHLGDTYTYQEVDPETVGQYIGRKDKNGKDIYEGDTVPIKVGIQSYAHWTVGKETSINGFVEWNEHQMCWQIGFKNNIHNIISSSFGWHGSPEIEVIGTIHDGTLPTKGGSDGE